MENIRQKKSKAHAVRGRGRPIRATEKTLMIPNGKIQRPNKVGTGGSKRSLRQLACDMAEAGYMPSRNASKNTTSKEADLTYGRLVAYIQPKNGHYNDVTWDEFYSAIKSCKLEVADHVSKRDLLDLYLGRPHKIEVFNHGGVILSIVKGAEKAA